MERTVNQEMLVTKTFTLVIKSQRMELSLCWEFIFTIKTSISRLWPKNNRLHLLTESAYINSNVASWKNYKHQWKRTIRKEYVCAKLYMEYIKTCAAVTIWMSVLIATTQLRTDRRCRAHNKPYGDNSKLDMLLSQYKEMTSYEQIHSWVTFINCSAECRRSIVYQIKYTLEAWKETKMKHVPASLYMMVQFETTIEV